MLYIDLKTYTKLPVKGCIKGKGTIIISTTFSIKAFSSTPKLFRSRKPDNTIVNVILYSRL